MSDMKWIKIDVDLFDNDKIRLIENLPNSDAIIIIWLKLLCFAGKQYSDGIFQLGDTAYTYEMFSVVLRRSVSEIKEVFAVFEKFGMIKRLYGKFSVKNWSKYQSVDPYEKRKEFMRNYMKKYRSKMSGGNNQNENPKCKPNSKVYGKLYVNHIEEDKEKDKDKDKKYIKKEICKEKKEPPPKRKYGEYKNVYLSDAELDKLKEEFSSDYMERIERVSEYVATTGKVYKNFLAVIRSWSKKEKESSVASLNSAKMSEWESSMRELEAIKRDPNIK